MIFRIAVILLGLCAVDAYFFHGRHVAAAMDLAQNFGTYVNDGVSQFTRRLQ